MKSCHEAFFKARLVEKSLLNVSIVSTSGRFRTGMAGSESDRCAFSMQGRIPARQVLSKSARIGIAATIGPRVCLSRAGFERPREIPDRPWKAPSILALSPA
jgi:hypothetical protein